MVPEPGPRYAPVMPADRPIRHGDELGKCFYVADAPSLLIRSCSRAQVAVTRLTLPDGPPDLNDSPHSERVFTIPVHLTDPDVRTTAFDAVRYHLPRTTLDAFTEDNGLPKVDTLLCALGTRDPILGHLTRMLLPHLAPPSAERPERGPELSNLFFAHFIGLLCGHLVQTYGTVKTPPPVQPAGLAPWQVRRTRELLHAHLDGDLRLSALATECGLSVSHFARSFKRSFGSPVHRYVIAQRVEAAKTLLRHTSKSLANIALEAGFSDQPALNRAFRSIVGTSPGRWRAQAGRT
jgi:AraC family transcriptional regulator